MFRVDAGNFRWESLAFTDVLESSGCRVGVRGRRGQMTKREAFCCIKVPRLYQTQVLQG